MTSTVTDPTTDPTATEAPPAGRRYRSTTLVRIPSAWKGRFRYASCFRYTGGSGMGNPRSSCPQRFRF